MRYEIAHWRCTLGAVGEVVVDPPNAKSLRKSGHLRPLPDKPTKADLVERAKDAGVAGASKMTKAELQEALDNGD